MEITGLQVRAARILLGWKAVDLAVMAGIHVATVQRFETGSKVIPAIESAIIGALEEEGVEFPANGVILVKGSAS